MIPLANNPKRGSGQGFKIHIFLLVFVPTNLFMKSYLFSISDEYLSFD